MELIHISWFNLNHNIVQDRRAEREREVFEKSGVVPQVTFFAEKYKEGKNILSKLEQMIGKNSGRFHLDE